MDLSLSKIQHPTDKYFIQRCSLDNNQIFKRGTTIKEKNIYTKSNFFDYNVYLFIDKRFSTKIILPGNVIIFKKIIYVGKGIFNKLNLFDSRACKHHNDLLSKIILDEPNNYECLFFGDGMTYNEASCLEAL